MWLLGLLFVFATSQFVPIPPAQCASQLANTLQSPPETATLPRCNITGLACCNAAFDSAVGSPSDPITPGLLGFFNNPGASCQAEITKIGCAPCRADSGIWFQAVGTPAQPFHRFVVCDSFCSSLYQACSEDLAASAGTSVRTAFDVPALFCKSLFKKVPNLGIELEDSYACFDPNRRACTESDIAWSWTDCHNSVHSLDFRFKPTRDCVGGVTLPPSLEDVKCPLSCSSGQYLPLGNTTCKACPDGTYSLGGGLRIDHWIEWSYQGLEFDTYCETPDGVRVNDTSRCGGWSLNTTFADANLQGKHGLNSVLEATFRVIKAGSLVFYAEVESEDYFDRFLFSLDGKEDWLGRSKLGTQKYTYPLAAGLHSIKFVYSKDDSINFGRDTVTLFQVSIPNLGLMNEVCSSCAPGYTPNGLKNDCVICPHGSVAVPGQSHCSPCPEFSYALSPSASCTMRLACTTNDMHHEYTPCDFRTGSRTKYWVFNEPHICAVGDSFLPPNTTVTCAPCNPGYHANHTGEACLPCPPGTSSSLGSVDCTPCPVHTYAPKQFYVHSWEHYQFQSIAHSTSCTGTCATPGFQMRETSLDTGSGHGLAVLSFTLRDFVIEQPVGSLSVSFGVQCDGVCIFEVVVNDERVNFNSFFFQSQNKTVEVPLYRGKNTITFAFEKLTATRNGDHLMIYAVEIDGSATGGAAHCLTCPIGTLGTTEGQSSCRPCPLGQSAAENASACVICPANEHSYKTAHLAGPICKPCGRNTQTPPGSTQCSTNNCAFLSPHSGRMYDLSPLKGQVYGPVDSFYHAYWLNLCSYNPIPECIDEHGVRLNTFACQTNFYHSGLAIDLGNVMGYDSYYDNTGTESGVIVMFQGSEKSCINTDGHEVSRTTEVVVQCSPADGAGHPRVSQFMDESNCRYHFHWDSIYGCHICYEADVASVIGECINGTRTIFRSWKQPKLCVGGDPYLVGHDEEVCGDVSSLVCAPGTYASVTGGCVVCPATQYSIGSGHVFTTWPPNLSPFHATCENQPETDPCHSWYSLGDAVQSGTSHTSVLSLVIDQQDSRVPLQFEVLVSGLSPDLLVSVDSVETLHIQAPTSGRYVHESFVLSPGNHLIQWKFTPGRSWPDGRPAFARLRTISVGMAASALECTQCPAAQTNNPTHTGCTECPQHQTVIHTPNTSQCTPCPSSEFRFATLHECVPKPACGAAHRIEIRSNGSSYCGATNPGVITQYSPLAPLYCAGGLGDVPTRVCIPCPLGTFFRNDRCISCTGVQFPSDSACVNPAPGFVSFVAKSYFGQFDVPTSASFPPEFTTYCIGPGCTTKGWRHRGNRIDTGLHFGEAESTLQMVFTARPQNGFRPIVRFITQRKAIPFGEHQKKRQSVSPIGDSYVRFFINGVPQQLGVATDGVFQIPYEPRFNTFELPTSAKPRNYTLTWKFTQSYGADYIELYDLIVLDHINGIPMGSRRCPPGYLRNGDQHTCVACPAGTYQNGDQCRPCEGRTVSISGRSYCVDCPISARISADHTTCNDNCVFSFDNIDYDLSSKSAGVITTANHHQFQINPCQATSFEGSPVHSSYVFYSDGHDVYSLGTHVQVIPGIDEAHSEYGANTINLLFSSVDSLDNLPPSCQSVSTIVEMMCTSDQDSEDTPTLVSISPDLCTSRFVWRTSGGCKKCTQYDFENKYGICQIQGVQDVVPTKNSTCSGPVRKPYVRPCLHVQVTQLPGLIVFICVISFILICLLGAVACGYRGCRAGSKFQQFLERRGAKKKVEHIHDDQVIVNIQVDPDSSANSSGSSSFESSSEVSLSDGD